MTASASAVSRSHTLQSPSNYSVKTASPLTRYTDDLHAICQGGYRPSLHVFMGDVSFNNLKKSIYYSDATSRLTYQALLHIELHT